MGVKIKIKDHLSLAEAEVEAEVGNIFWGKYGKNVQKCHIELLLIFSVKLRRLGLRCFMTLKIFHTLIFFSMILTSMDMLLDTFTIYGVLKLHEFLAYDWSIYSCLKPLVTKLEILCGDMTVPLSYTLILCPCVRYCTWEPKRYKDFLLS